MLSVFLYLFLVVYVLEPSSMNGIPCFGGWITVCYLMWYTVLN